MKKNNSTSFSQKYDALFEKPKVHILSSKQIRILVLLGIIAIGIAVSIPYLSTIFIVSSTERIINSHQKKLDQLAEEQPFTIVDIFKKHLTIDYPPNYQKAKNYELTLDGDTLNFGNGYVLEFKNATIYENHLSEITLKPTERYDPAESLLSVKASDPFYSTVTDGKNYAYDYTNPIAADTHVVVHVTGNLLESIDMQEMKEEGSFLELFQQENIGEVKTGIVVNYHPYHGRSDNKDNEIPQGHIYLTRYWLFPDGVGVTIGKGGNYLGRLTSDEDDQASTDYNLKVIDGHTNKSITWLDEHFELKQVAR